MKNKKVQLLLFAFILITVLTAGIFTYVFAEEIHWTLPSLEDTYFYGTELEIPEAKYYNTVAESTVIFPDGNATYMKNIKLNVAGEYTVVYTANVGSRNYTKSLRFKVIDNIAKIGENSTLSYGRPENASENGEGLIVELASGENLEFNNVFDLTNATSQDTVISFYICPQVKGAYDFSQIVITFTDIADPECCMKFEMHRSAEANAEVFSYSKAKGNGQPYTGIEELKGKIHINNEYGCIMLHSFSGEYESLGDKYLYFDSVPVDLRFDVAENKLYYFDAYDRYNLTVIDFDDTNYFTNLWEGFTSGKVRMSISANDLSSSRAKFVITELMGVDLKECYENGAPDTKAPEITVFSDYDSMPDALVGSFYPVPEAYAIDEIDREVDVFKAVYYVSGIQSDTIGSTVSIEDGKFKALRTGVYTIVYTARDSYGNVAQKELIVKAKNTLPQIDLELPTEYVTECNTGELVDISAPIASGGSGNLTYNAEAIFGGTRYDLNSGSFRPMISGTYKITYTVNDFAGQEKTVFYDLKVVNSAYPVVVDEPVLPKYLFSDTATQIEDLYAADFSNGSRADVKTDISFIDSLGKHNVVNNTFTPHVDVNGESVRVIYSYKGHDVKIVDIPVIRSVVNERMQMINYFALTDCNIEYASGSDGVTISSASSSCCAEYANKLLADTFSISLLPVADKSSFNSFDLILSDSENESEILVINVSRSGKASKIMLGDKLFDCVYVFDGNYDIVISYSQKRFSVLVNGKRLNLNITNDYKGKAFKGFSSGFVYAKIVLNETAEGNSALNICNISGQSFSASYADKVSPNVFVAGDIVTRVKINEKVTVPAVYVGDVLDPNSYSTLSVTFNGEYVTSTDGTLLKDVPTNRAYDFFAKEYGNYQINILAKDYYSALTNKQKTTTVSKVVSVVDTNAPSIVFKHKFKETVKVGEYIVIPDFIVSDNQTDQSDIIVDKYIYTCNGRLIELANDVNAFKPQYTGIYQVRVVVRDAAGNTTYYQTDINVVK